MIREEHILELLQAANRCIEALTTELVALQMRVTALEAKGAAPTALVQDYGLRPDLHFEG